jgi:hypothetical protein
MDDLTQSELQELLHYDPLTGVFTWLKARRGVKVGAECGRINVHGYREIGVKLKLRQANRLAWLYMKGELPPDNMEVDHRNRDKADNRWDNLRLATKSQNAANVATKTNNTSGIPGVVWDAQRNCWRAQLRVDGVKKNLGRFATKEEAAAKVASVAKAQWGEFWAAA